MGRWDVLGQGIFDDADPRLFTPSAGVTVYGTRYNSTPKIAGYNNFGDWEYADEPPEVNNNLQNGGSPIAVIKKQKSPCDSLREKYANYLGTNNTFESESDAAIAAAIYMAIQGGPGRASTIQEFGAGILRFDSSGTITYGFTAITPGFYTHDGGGNIGAAWTSPRDSKDQVYWDAIDGKILGVTAVGFIHSHYDNGYTGTSSGEYFSQGDIQFGADYGYKNDSGEKIGQTAYLVTPNGVVKSASTTSRDYRASNLKGAAIAGAPTPSEIETLSNCK